MVRSFRLLRITLFCLYVGTAYSSAKLSPATIKTQVESCYSYNYYSYGSQTPDQVAQNVLASNSLDTLLATYPIETIVGWNNGTNFFSYLRMYADDSAKQKIVASCKNYIQTQLKKIWLGDIATVATPTALHAFNDIENTEYVVSTLDTSSNYKQHLKEIAPLLCLLVKEEKALSDKGYCVFFHGQRWQYLFGEKLYTDLWALTKNKARQTNYLFPHVRVAGLDPEETYGKLDRKTLVKNVGYDANNNYIYSSLLFTTNYLFGNYKNYTCSSPLSYFLTDSNIGNVQFSLDKIFTHYELAHLYTKHSQEIANLQTHFNAARKFGTILRIAVPKKLVNEYCFGQYFAKGTDTLAFLEKQRNLSQMIGYEAFCLVMLDEAMNPEGGILIKAYHCAEQTEWQKFETGYEQLIKKLATEINPPATMTKPPVAVTKKPLKKK